MILREHAARYPLMEPQDYAKLAFQSEFGPEHMVTDREAVLRYLKQEWSGLPEGGLPVPPEPIGGGLCRIHLAGCSERQLPLLADLFFRSAQEHYGTLQGLHDRLTLVRALNVPGMETWLAEYEAAACPMVRHSETFRMAYEPHYRVIKLEYAEEL